MEIQHKGHAKRITQHNAKPSPVFASRHHLSAIFFVLKVCRTPGPTVCLKMLNQYFKVLHCTSLLGVNFLSTQIPSIVVDQTTVQLCS